MSVTGLNIHDHKRQTKKCQNDFSQQSGYFQTTVLVGYFFQPLTVDFGKFPRISIKAWYICSWVPSKNFPQPDKNNVSPAKKMTLSVQ